MSKVKDPLDPISRTPSSEGAPPDPFAEPEVSHSPLLILFGLLVVWGSLYLVAIAQGISHAPPAGDPAKAPSTVAAAPRPQPTGPGSGPVSSMLMPVESLNLREIPARQVVKDLLYKAHLHITPRELDKIGAEVRNVRFENKPLYECIYSTLGEDTLGLMVVDDEVRLIPQEVSHKFPDQGPLEQFHWEANLLLSDRAASLFPSGRSNLWIRLRLLPLEDEADDDFRIAFEIFRGSVREGSGEAILPAPGAGTLRFVTGSSVSLRIENRKEVGTPDGTLADEFPIGVSLQFQSPETLADQEAGDTAPPDAETSSTLESSEG